MMKHLAADDRVIPLKSKLMIGEECEESMCRCEWEEEYQNLKNDINNVKEVVSDDAFIDAIKKLSDDPPTKHLPPGYYLQHRYQDSGWVDLDERYLEPGTAIDKACKYSLDAIAYGMTRVLDNKGNILKTFSCGKEV